MKKFTTELVQNQITKQHILPKCAIKNAEVKAHRGKIGEEVDTRLRVSRDGKLYVIGETKNKVTVEGSMIVQNPDGEEYIVKPDKFDSKYTKVEGKTDVYKPVATPIAYVILDRDIVFKASWGEEMYALKGAALNITDINGVYAINNEAFAKTYTVGRDLTKSEIEKIFNGPSQER